MNLKIHLLFCKIIFFCNAIYAQDETFVGPNFFIAMSWGYSYDCSESGNSYLELNDTTLIPFNDHSTFEDRLLLDRKISISPGNYKIHFITDENGIIATETFTITAEHKGETIFVKFDSLKCCQSSFGTYLMFEKDSSYSTESHCSGINPLVSKIQNDSANFNVIAYYNYNISETLAKERLENLKSILVSKNVKLTNLTFEIEFRENLPFFPNGGNIVYYPDECLCCDERPCSPGIVLVKK